LASEVLNYLFSAFQYIPLALGQIRLYSDIFLFLIGVMRQPSWFRFQWWQVKTSSAALSAVQKQGGKSPKVGTDRIAALAVLCLHLELLLLTLERANM
jgi:hypothetical protein